VGALLHDTGALAVKNVPIALLEQFDFAGEPSLHNLLPASPYGTSGSLILS
jgi:hypothetical protein